MKFFFVLILIVSASQLAAQHSSIFPQPTNVEYTTEQFVFNGQLALDSTKVPKKLFEYIQKSFGRIHAIHLEASSAKNANIQLQQVNTLVYTEGYQLSVTNSGIEIQYSSYQSLCNAFQSLNQLFQNQTKLAGIRISDQPAFAYRGVHLDCSRHFFTIAELEGFIDQIARLKFNKFHWHLTDDQGWRIEIKKYPKLTTIGAWRDSTLIGHFSKQPIEYEHQKYGGFYTQEEAKELIEYARIRGIEIIPEIEMPGHARAALAAYPELSCTEKQLPVVGTWGVFDDVFCSQEKTRTFLKDVLDEVIAIFPSQVIHIGGDESPKVRWEACPKCKAVMNENQLHSTHELQSFFIRDIEKHVNSKGRTIIGWDEILEGGLAPNAQVMSWQGMEGGIAAAKQKHQVVMTPTSYCYLDYYQSGHPSEPLAIGGYLPLEKVYQFDPTKGIENEYKRYILGGQANLWTEYLPTMSAVQYNLFPRLLAMSEVLWTKEDQRKSYPEFVQGLIKYQFPYYDSMNINFSTACLEPKLLFSKSEKGLMLEAVSNIEHTKASIELIFENPALICELPLIKAETFSIGDYPDTSNHSKLLLYPLPISASFDLEVKVTKKGDLLRVNKYEITTHLALGKPITFDTPPNEKYNANGDLGLTDGIVGKKPWKGNQWLGFTEDTVRFRLDLGKKIKFGHVKLGYLNDPGSWIYAPEKCVIEVSKNGRKWKKTTVPDNDTLSENFYLHEKLKARHLRITVINKEKIPEGMTGAGFTPWTFLNELIITR
ncbi:glycoside hydrolase family 20 protein [Fluviicola taffensis]|uniref:beta-N-acetylhexosaminidase n=1 Tax=Fluviicola taffensis (strain DSM 16823 / NCIMB 13979 / RW262) TaxID=755732 RepID=F2ICU7_FLUTR|nr:family 20 glycosylhydrolase [Fluviicola taffensis]AEA43321.1 Beta-N-acetylhexosaminidase [Fluviicola taffensis DSM 16823]